MRLRYLRPVVIGASIVGTLSATAAAFLGDWRLAAGFYLMTVVLILAIVRISVAGVQSPMRPSGAASLRQGYADVAARKRRTAPGSFL
jgi:hypothetical protein